MQNGVNSPPTSPEADKAEDEGSAATETVHTSAASKKASYTQDWRAKEENLKRLKIDKISSVVDNRSTKVRAYRVRGCIEGESFSRECTIPDVANPVWMPTPNDKILYLALLDNMQKRSEEVGKQHEEYVQSRKTTHISVEEAKQKLAEFSLSIEDSTRSPSGMRFYPSHLDTDRKPYVDFSMCGTFPHMVKFKGKGPDLQYWVVADKMVTITVCLKHANPRSNFTEHSLRELVAAAEGKPSWQATDPIKFHLALEVIAPRDEPQPQPEPVRNIAWKCPIVGSVLDPPDHSPDTEGHYRFGMRANSYSFTFSINPKVTNPNMHSHANKTNAEFVFVLRCLHPLLKDLEVRSVRFKIIGQLHNGPKHHFVRDDNSRITLLKDKTVEMKSRCVKRKAE